MTNEQVTIFKRYYSSTEAAQYLGLSRSHMSNMRLKGNGPNYYKLESGGIRYDRDDLDAWVKGEQTDE